MQGKTQEMILLLRKAITINPNYAEAYFNLGVSLKKQGSLQPAIDAYRQALAIKPSYPENHCNPFLIQLLPDDHESGWKGYEWRFWVKDNLQPYAYPQVERWTGSNLLLQEKI
ncbi:MAG: hypothetical protein TE42_08325 [Candidatus Synechococcus spongiarum SP3]|uniref:Uncharacterized protein n=1 Tax=Candidatus Synechococcus spongiarum SP3 TaxID=1604020 RepID=A0A0G2J4C5_9SYNE|nr:MAG: hypothetical protein TE42_08325 [Candidatus Synechococcus spongiarum SP3]